MTSQAPVCHIPPNTSTEQPAPHNLPAIPPASPNLSSLTATVNALRQYIISLNQQRGRPQWTEYRRVTGITRVFNPSDPTQYVDVEQINQLVMVDKVTGQTWTWTR